MKSFKQGMLAATLLFAYPVLACTPDGLEGFVPENNLSISADAKRLGGITEIQFNDVIDKVSKLYAPIITGMGATLKVERNWKDTTVNAYAQQNGKTWMVSMFGGLARHDTITEDGFALVVCHEIGHHIGGAPRKVSTWASPWASNEGQADYFATLKCLRKTWQSDNNDEIVAAMTVPAALRTACEKEQTPAEVSICIRGGLAGQSVSYLFQALRQSQIAPKFDTPDPKVVVKTDDNHPATQCRMDTYFQGALCDVSMNDDVSATSEVTGTCHATLGHSTGLRPLCWFRPAVQ